MSDKIAFVFPGQGSQYVSMGKELYDHFFHLGDTVFEICGKITGLPIKKICFEGSIEELTSTDVLQPALTAVEIMIANIVMESGIKPDVLAGHSLGEYSALAISGILNMGDTFKLVKERGRLMEDECQITQGAMAAIIGLDMKTLNEMLADFSPKGVLVPANHNSPEQIIVTGEKKLLDEFIPLVKQKGAKAIPLKVSGAFHSQLMQGAKDKFASLLKNTAFYQPIFNFYSNVTGNNEKDPAKIRLLMAEQLISPVLWVKEVNSMKEFGVNIFIEIGPKQVLSNLIKKCNLPGDIRIYSIENLAGLEKCLKEIG
jgi:[acyl-carrier-protein] S-malonyltransferase